MILVRASLVFALAVTAVAHADVVNLKCVQTNASEYALSYTLTGATRSVEIFASKDPNAPVSSTALRKTTDTKISLHAGRPGDRMYFFVKANTGELREVSVRRLALEGAPNFRDLGGYRTADGRFTRWGLIYRSGVLTYLTTADYNYLSHLGIRVVCDFRTRQENEAAAERWIPGASVEMISLPIGTEPNKQGQQATVQSLMASSPTAEQLRARMIASYSEFAFSSSSQYAAVFQQLKSEHLPLLVHCTAGKDRTGVFSALLLLTLGVPETSVVEDYELTNRYLREAGQSGVTRKIMKASGSSMASLSKEQQDVVMAADPAYLESMLRQIDTRYGSFDNYRRQELKVSDADMQALRARLTLP